LDIATRFLGAQNPPPGLTTFPFLFQSRSQAPLSWHLTKEQKADIGGSWANEDDYNHWREVS
jgi:hypothetical protein